MRGRLVAGVIVVALAAGGIAAGLELAETGVEDMSRPVTPPSQAELDRVEPSSAPPATLSAVDLDSGSCLDHPADEPSSQHGAYVCEALTYNADGTCTLESVTIENWRPVSARRTVVRCP